MKKILVLTLLVSSFQMSFGQIYFNDDHTDTAEGMYTKFDLATHIYFVNKSADTSFTWRRYDVNVPDGVATAVCDNNLCYPPEVSTANYDLGTNDSFEMILHFYPDNNCGRGSFKLLVFPQADTNNKIIAEAFTSIWCLGVNSVQVNALGLYPNPSSSEIEITFGAIDEYDIIIYDIKGQKMIQTSSRSLTKRLDIKGLMPGMYMVAVQSGDRTFTQTFIRN